MSPAPLVSSAEADEYSDTDEVAGESSAVALLLLRRVFFGGRGGAASCKMISEATAPRGDTSRLSKSVEGSYDTSNLSVTEEHSHMCV